MKIIVVNSPLYNCEHLIKNEDYLPPLGLGEIYSSLSNIYDVEFIDSLADNLSVEDLIALLKLKNPDFVCINIFTTNYIQVKRIVEESPKIPHWIIGGISTKSLYKEIFHWKTDNKIDIVYGDGEKIVIDLVAKNIKCNTTDSENNRRYFVVDRSSLYFNINISEGIVDRNIFKYEPEKNCYGEFEICIYTSRGCPYSCAYCVAAHNRNSELGGPRHKTSECIVRELELIRELYPNVGAIRIVDDLFLSDKQSFIDASEIFLNFDYSWRAMCHIQSINRIQDDFIISNLFLSGCKELFIGIESGSPRLLKAIHKTDEIDVVKKSIIRVLDLGISVKGYFICGFPNEDISDLDKTYELVKYLTDYKSSSNSRFRNSTFQYRPYYGTELYDSIVDINSMKYNSILYKTEISQEINFLVRNKSFNFDSGNYSAVDDHILHEYLKKINDLNDRTP